MKTRYILLLSAALLAGGCETRWRSADGSQGSADFNRAKAECKMEKHKLDYNGGQSLQQIGMGWQVYGDCMAAKGFETY